MINRETAAALAGSAGQVLSIMLLLGSPVSEPRLMELTAKSQKTIRRALAALASAALVAEQNGLWITTPEPVDNSIEDKNGDKIGDSFGDKKRPNGTENDPKNVPTSHARVSSSSKQTKKEGKGNAEPKTPAPFQRDPREAHALRQTLAEAGIARYSTKMDEILAAHWVTPDYAAAHIANMKRRHEPVAYLIRRLLDGEVAPNTFWLEQAAQEIDPPRPSPDATIAAPTATSSEASLPPHPQPPPISSLWRSVLDELKLQMDTAVFNTWLTNTNGFEQDGELVVLMCNEMGCDWVTHRLAPTILNTYNAIASSPCTSLNAITQAQWATQEVTS